MPMHATPILWCPPHQAESSLQFFHRKHLQRMFHRSDYYCLSFGSIQNACFVFEPRNGYDPKSRIPAPVPKSVWKKISQHFPPKEICVCVCVAGGVLVPLNLRVSWWGRRILATMTKPLCRTRIAIGHSCFIARASERFTHALP